MSTSLFVIFLFVGKTFGLDILPPPGSWGDPCAVSGTSSSFLDDNSPDLLFEKAMEVYGRENLPQGISEESCNDLDPALARTFLMNAAKGGHIFAAYLLGLIYQKGTYVKADLAEAKIWFEKASQLGFSEAKVDLGKLLLEGISGKPDYPGALQWFSQAAQEGAGEAAFYLSTMYERGLGVLPDPAKASHWLQEAVKAGSPNGLYTLGERMLLGTGVPQDVKQGLELIQKASTQGLPEAHLALGSALLKGDGINKDTEKGQRLLEKALIPFVIQGKNEMVVKVLDAGVSPNFHYDSQVTSPDPKHFKDPIATTGVLPSNEKVPLIALAVEYGQVDTVRLLIQRGASVNAQRTLTRKTALWTAAAAGHVKVVELLLRLGADPNMPSVSVDGLPSQAPLEVARANGFTEVVEILKKARAIERPVSPNLLARSQRPIEYRSLETNDVRPFPIRRVPTPLPDYVATLIQHNNLSPSLSWFDDQKKIRHQSLLQQGTFDVLVVPFQVQHFGIDAIGRSLMTAYLVDYLQKTTSLEIPDPSLVLKALGENARTYKKEEVYHLAQQLGVKTIVWSYVGHDRLLDMRVTLQIQRRDESGLHENTPIIQWDSESLRFSDETPPEEVFLMLIPQIGQHLEITTPRKLPPPLSKPVESQPPILPQSPQQLINSVGTDPLTRAYYLQVLGTLFPHSTERAKERLFEKSLLALNQLHPATPGWRLLKARALFHLKRRPAALAVLGEPATPADKAFLALLNGNLPEMEFQFRQIDQPINFALTVFDLFDLRSHYHKTENKERDQETLAKQFPGWAPLMIRRAVDLDDWHPSSNVLIKALLDQAFPLSNESLQDLVSEQTFLQESDPSMNAIERSVRSHIQETMKVQSRNWCCFKNLHSPHPLDYLELLESLAEANLLHAVWHEYGIQGNYKAAIDILYQIDSLYSGHPAFARHRHSIGVAFVKAQKQDTNFPALRRDYQGLLNAMLWSGGQTLSTMEVTWVELENFNLFQKMPEVDKQPIVPLWILFVRDLPRRSYWLQSEIGSSQETYFRNLEQSLKYTHSSFSVLKEMHDWLTGQDKKSPEGKAVLEANSHRFIGDPERESWMTARQFQLGNPDEGIRQYKAAINQGTTDWEQYEKLGTYYILEGHYEEAMKVFKRFPEFHQKNPENPIRISNLAYNVGSLLFWRGAVQMAIPMYQISANLQTGSDASLSSELRLAMLDGDYRTAAKISLTRAKRYNSVYAFRDYLTFLHLLGFSKQSWAGFGSLLGKFDTPQIWTSAFIGHRLEGRSDQDIQAWLDEQNKREPLHPEKSFPARFAFMIFNIDRPPSASRIDLIETYEAKFPSKFGVSGHIFNVAGKVVGPSSYKDYDRHHVILPTDYQPGKPKKDLEQIKAQAGQTVDSELTLFAKGYAALRTKDYETALHWFEKRARFYTYGEEDQTSYALPYFAWAASQSGKGDAFRIFLDRFKDPGYIRDWYQGFDYFLAEAFWAGGQGQHDQAVQFLHQAFAHRPHTEMRPMFSWYQIVEACEMLFEATRNDKYRNLALKWAKEYQVIQPMFAWAYGVEVKYSKDPTEKQRALALALFLDQNSERIQGISESEKQQALKWLSTNNPFRQAEFPAVKMKM